MLFGVRGRATKEGINMDCVSEDCHFVARRFVKESVPDPLEERGIFLPPIPAETIGKDETYAYAIQRAWDLIGEYDKTGLLIVEHDITFRAWDFSLIQERIMENPDYIWAFPYYLYPATTGRKERVIAHRISRYVYPGFPSHVQKIPQRVFEWATIPDEVTNRPTPSAYVQPINRFGLGATYVPARAFYFLRNEWDYPSVDSLWSAALDDAGFTMYMPCGPLVLHFHEEGWQAK